MPNRPVHEVAQIEHNLRWLAVARSGPFGPVPVRARPRSGPFVLARPALASMGQLLADSAGAAQPFKKGVFCLGKTTVWAKRSNLA